MFKGILVAIALVAGSSAADARGGADFMNSPGYQRRLQESRGYVTNRSGSILPAAPVRRDIRPRRHHWR
jgi:hypothetical protein